MLPCICTTGFTRKNQKVKPMVGRALMIPLNTLLEMLTNIAGQNIYIYIYIYIYKYMNDVHKYYGYYMISFNYVASIKRGYN